HNQSSKSGGAILIRFD
ncbi:hypothetical protein A8O80_14690, partial [Listeria monocytogenes]|nr:hypothetical protein [Listeria monocytogenes]